MKIFGGPGSHDDRYRALRYTRMTHYRPDRVAHDVCCPHNPVLLRKSRHASETIRKLIEPVEPIIEPTQKHVEPVEPKLSGRSESHIFNNTRRSYWFYGTLCRFYDGAALVLLVLVVSL